LGQKQTLHWSNLMSALPPKADIRQHDFDVRFVPLADIGKAFTAMPQTQQSRWPGE
jgi:hypothetical protein